MKRIALYSIKLYRLVLGPFLPRVCRYVPSCSQYAYEAIEHYGIGKGLAAAAWRILRCNPFCAGGYDPVRPAKSDEVEALNTKVHSRSMLTHGHCPGAAHD